MLAFWILAFIVLASAVAVVVLPNPLHSALCLVTNLVAVAGIYALLGAHFLAAVQVIVYAGAIMVLVVFVLMLLNVKAEGRSLGDYLVSLIALSASAICAYLVFPLIHSEFKSKQYLVGSAGEPTEGGSVQIGARIFGDQSFLFQLTGVILITAIVGAVMLASQRKIVKSVGGK